MQTFESQSATTTVRRLEDIREFLTTSLAMALRTQPNIADLRGETEGKRDIISQQTTMLHQIKINLDSLQDLMRVIPVEQRILRHVFYKSMYDREEAIHDAEEGTFAWLLEGSDDDSSSEASSAESGSDGMINSNPDEEFKIRPRRRRKRRTTGEDPPADRGDLSESDSGTDEDDLPGSDSSNEVEDFQKFEENQREERHRATGKLIDWLNMIVASSTCQAKPGLASRLL